MSGEVPNLRVVNTETGEVVEGEACAACASTRGIVEQVQTELDMANRELSGYRLRLAQSEAAVRDLHVTDPESEQVAYVLRHWARRVVEDGWWSRTPKFKPGCPRWTVVRARLKDGYDANLDLVAAVEGALLPQKGGVKREWLDVTTILRNGSNLERARERFYDPRALKVIQWRQLPEALVRMGPMLDQQCHVCDCGHLRLFHITMPGFDGLELCKFCDCGGFSDMEMERAAYEKKEGQGYDRWRRAQHRR